MPLLLLSSSTTPPPWVQFSNRVPLNTKFWNNNRPFKIVIWNTRLIFHALAYVDETERVNYVLKTQRHHDRFSIFSRVKTSNCDLKLGSITRIHHCLVIGNTRISFVLCLRRWVKKIVRQSFAMEKLFWNYISLSKLWMAIWKFLNVT